MRISQQVGQERVHIHYLSGRKIEDQYAVLGSFKFALSAVLGSFKQPPVTSFGSLQCFLGSITPLNIANGTGNQHTLLLLHRAQRDPHRDFAPILVPHLVLKHGWPYVLSSACCTSGENRDPGAVALA